MNEPRRFRWKRKGDIERYGVVEPSGSVRLYYEHATDVLCASLEDCNKPPGFEITEWLDSPAEWLDEPGEGWWDAWDEGRNDYFGRVYIKDSEDGQWFRHNGGTLMVSSLGLKWLRATPPSPPPAPLTVEQRAERLEKALRDAAIVLNKVVNSGVTGSLRDQAFDINMKCREALKETGATE